MAEQVAKEGSMYAGMKMKGAQKGGGWKGVRDVESGVVESGVGAFGGAVLASKLVWGSSGGASSDFDWSSG